MAYAGRIFPKLTQIEIDESNNVWQIINNFGDTVIEELEAVSKGTVEIDQLVYRDEDDDCLDELWDSVKISIDKRK